MAGNTVAGPPNSVPVWEEDGQVEGRGKECSGREGTVC